MTTVGKFTWTGKEIIGPKGYMEDPSGFSKIRADLETGRSVVMQAAPIGTNPITLMLVAIQTHYAGWEGMQEALRWCGGKAS